MTSTRFCAHVYNHKSFTYEKFALEYCFVKSSLTIAEASLNQIQLYRRPFAFIFFTICHTSEEFRIVLDEYTKIKQKAKDAYTHLFVRYRNTNSQDDDELLMHDKLVNEPIDES